MLFLFIGQNHESYFKYTYWRVLKPRQGFKNKTVTPTLKKYLKPLNKYCLNKPTDALTDNIPYEQSI